MNVAKTRIILGILFCVAVLVGGCWLLPPNDQADCTPPPDGFGEDTLVGNWFAGFPPDRNDTLLIREDGMYKQIVSVPVYNLDYESDWNEWWIEYSATGIPYLHLEGMSICAWAPDEVACEVPGAGKMWWYDGCKGESFQMPEGEVVLIILGVPEQFNQPPRGFTLDLPGGHDRSWFYSLIEP